MQTFKQYVTEGMPVFTPKGEATYVEDVIIHCINTFNKAKTEQKVLRYIGTWDGSKVRAGLEAVDQKSPFYHQLGSENLILFKTKRYHDVPLVIKGYGAGAGVTATGLLQDIQACIKN